MRVCVCVCVLEGWWSLECRRKFWLHAVGQLSLPEAREVVLEYIVERKRMDDLARSIVDKRFGEQKVCV